MRDAAARGVRVRLFLDDLHTSGEDRLRLSLVAHDNIEIRLFNPFPYWRSNLGMGQMLFGSDYPYLRRDLAVACRHEVETSAELASEESRAVLADNALKLFPRLAARAPTEKEGAQTLRTRSA